MPSTLYPIAVPYAGQGDHWGHHYAMFTPLVHMQLSEDLPGVSLALSLHAPNQELRQSIVPSARAYKLDKLMAAVDTYEQSSRQKVTGLAPSSDTPQICNFLEHHRRA